VNPRVSRVLVQPVSEADVIARGLPLHGPVKSGEYPLRLLRRPGYLVDDASRNPAFMVVYLAVQPGGYPGRGFDARRNTHLLANLLHIAPYRYRKPAGGAHITVPVDRGKTSAQVSALLSQENPLSLVGQECSGTAASYSRADYDRVIICLHGTILIVFLLKLLYFIVIGYDAIVQTGSEEGGDGDR
jgi:hypothetical protein